MIDRSSSSTQFSLTETIAESLSPHYCPFTFLNNLTRFHVALAKYPLVAMFLLECLTRLYLNYHRLIAIATKATRPPTCALFIELVFPKHSYENGYDRMLF